MRRFFFSRFVSGYVNGGYSEIMLSGSFECRLEKRIGGAVVPGSDNLHRSYPINDRSKVRRDMFRGRPPKTERSFLIESIHHPHYPHSNKSLGKVIPIK